MSLEDGIQPEPHAQDSDTSSTFLQVPLSKTNLRPIDPTKYRRVSQFKELGIDTTLKSPSKSDKPRRRVHFGSMADVFEAPSFDQPKSPDDDWPLSGRATPDYSVLLKTSVEPSPKLQYFTLSRLFTLTFIVAVVLTIVHNSPLIGSAGDTILGVKGGVIGFRARDHVARDRTLDARQQNNDDDPTNFCTRWAHQSAMVNGTIYIYGGRAKQQPQQTGNTWNNDFLTLDATKTWQISSPTFKGLDQPSGPPAVADAYLWHSYTQLFLYGGEYSDTPTTSPSAFALWTYDIPSSQWSEQSSPSTMSGNNSDKGNLPVQNAAEGAGVSIPELGRGFYFGGHLDFLTTQGWSNQVARIYLKSMVEYTFPGFSNDGIEALGDNKAAGPDGAWRNITEGGLQATDGFTERADGVLVHVPGFGQQGIILGLAGGNNQSFTEMNIIDVYDIATSTWYKQATTGNSPTIRVDPCAVAASAADGSSTNIYMYGGQNLADDPLKQVQYQDIWILTVPSFTWVKVDVDNLSNPPARAGHTCEIWDGQMVVIGGYVGVNISCDFPGIYVFDASELKWQNQFTALSGGNDQNQQESQTKNNTGLSGSFGYQVPAAVQSVIGGNGNGGATVTKPAAGATSGPLATGSPIVYTVTAGGSVVTETAGPDGTFSNHNQQSSSGPNVAAIVAGTVAGVLFIVACYLGFCAWVYRRQLNLYKNHVAAVQRAAAAPPAEKFPFLGQRSSEDPSSSNRRSTEANSTHPSGNSSRNPRSTREIPPPPLPGQQVGTTSTAVSSTEDLLTGQEPSFMGVLLNPRRSLRVVNRD